jgi:hypothetical protein
VTWRVVIGVFNLRTELFVEFLHPESCSLRWLIL